MWRLGEVQRAAKCAPKWLFVLICCRCRNYFFVPISDLEWKKPNIKQNRNISYVSREHDDTSLLFRVGKTGNSWNIIVWLFQCLLTLCQLRQFLGVLRKFKPFLWYFNIFFPYLVISHSFFVPIHLLPLRRVVLDMFSFTILLDIERPMKLTLWISKKWIITSTSGLIPLIILIFLSLRILSR